MIECQITHGFDDYSALRRAPLPRAQIQVIGHVLLLLSLGILCAPEAISNNASAGEPNVNNSEIRDRVLSDAPPALKPLSQVFDDILAQAQELKQLESSAVLDDEKLGDLYEDEFTNLWLELHDVRPSWGGIAIRLSDHGEVEAVRVRPSEDGLKRDTVRANGRIDAETAAIIFVRCFESGLLDLRGHRIAGLPEEGQPRIVLRGIVDGEEYTRSVKLWNREAQEIVSFQIVREQLKVLAGAILSVGTTGSSISRPPGVPPDNS